MAAAAPGLGSQLPQRRWRRRLVGGALLVGIFLAGALTVGVLSDLLGSSKSAPPIALAPLDASPDVTVVLSAGAIAALIQQSVAQGSAPIPLQDVQVGLAGGQLRVSGNVAALGQKVDVGVRLQPYVAGGQLKLRVLQAQLGPLPVPGDLAGLAEGPLDDRLRAVTADLGAEITGVMADQNVLTVTARMRGRRAAADSRSSWMPPAAATQRR